MQELESLRDLINQLQVNGIQVPHLKDGKTFNLEYFKKAINKIERRIVESQKLQTSKQDRFETINARIKQASVQKCKDGIYRIISKADEKNTAYLMRVKTKECSRDIEAIATVNTKNINLLKDIAIVNQTQTESFATGMSDLSMRRFDKLEDELI